MEGVGCHCCDIIVTGDQLSNVVVTYFFRMLYDAPYHSRI